MPEHFRPLPFDPSAEMVATMFDARSEDWLLAAPGDYQAAAVEAIKADGSAFQRLIAVEWPGRRNHSDELVTIRLLVSPEDAMGLAKVLVHTATWMDAATRMSQ